MKPGYTIENRGRPEKMIYVHNLKGFNGVHNIGAKNYYYINSLSERAKSRIVAIFKIKWK